MRSSRGLALIQQFEGFESEPYPDAAGVSTICYGASAIWRANL
jgi:GH24 family phage-related lysozyme (muramidase)